ncbi:MAG: ExeM/NucH family extracellular endonuclease, partial [Acidimicrobiia bacterium]
MTRRSKAILVVLGMVMTLIPTTAVLAAGSGTTINEIRIDQGGGDDDEYFELSGEPNVSLGGLTYVVIGDGSGGSGVIEEMESLDGLSLDADGFFVGAEDSFTLGDADLVANLNFENSDNVTHLLVDGFTGSNGDDLDTDDDGVLDVEPWANIVDSVSVVETFDFDDGDRIYGDATVGPDGSFVPGHAYDCDAFGWLIGAFAPLGRTDTPGAANDCEPDEVDIHDVQGSGGSSPLGGLLVSVSGVVVGDFQESGELGGFFLQDEEQDGDDETSEGVFVASTVPVAAGDVVEVTGLVGEPFNRTVIDGFDVIVVGSGASVVATLVSLPVADLFDLERFEGMLVTFAQDLFISEYFNFDRFNEIVLTTDRQFQGTHVAEPGAAANAVTDANELARITLDDGRSSQNPDPAIHPNGAEFTLTNTFRGGDILQDVTGVMDFAFGLYRIQPTTGATHINANPRPTSPDPIEGEVRVASFNVLNFFTHLDDGVDDCGPTGNLECRGADTSEELDRQLAKLVAGIAALDADIVGIQEIENDILESDGDRAHDAVLTLVEALNELQGAGTWAWVGEANHYNDYPVRNEIIYRTAAVELEGDPVALANDAFDKTRGDDIEPVGRPPLAQTFRQIVDRGSSQPFTVVVNHFKSKGSPCDDIEP